MSCHDKLTMSKTNLVPLSPQPLYEQIKDTLRARILDGSYPPHSRMPSESDCARCTA